MSTTVPDYQRVDVPELNSDILDQVKSNFDSSWDYEATRQPSLNALRLAYPTQVKADLDLGGNLRSDTQDQIMGAALHQASNSGIADSFSGRGLVAKDIGTSAETLRHSRMDRAGQELSAEPLEYLGLTGGQIGSVYVDDKVRDFQNRKDKAQAQSQGQAQQASMWMGLASALAGII